MGENKQKTTTGHLQEEVPSLSLPSSPPPTSPDPRQGGITHSVSTLRPKAFFSLFHEPLTCLSLLLSECDNLHSYCKEGKSFFRCNVSPVGQMHLVIPTWSVGYRNK